MSDYKKCPICGNYGWLNSHTCPPTWLVWDADEDDREGHYKIFAEDEKAAAEIFMIQIHSGWDYPDEIDVFVERLKPIDLVDPIKKRFLVCAELVPEFNATEKVEQK